MENLTDLQKIVATNDATTAGVLIAISVVFGVAIVFMFRHIIILNQEFRSELKACNSAMLQFTEAFTKAYKN